MSHVTQKQMRQLSRNPTAMMRFKATGQLPRTVVPSSPLIDLLERIPPRLRVQIRGVRLSPKLGYESSFQFHTAEQLLRWLKPDREMLANESWPAESRRNKRFAKQLTLDDLKAQCASWPSDEALSRLTSL